jgi:hypothetical protein
MPKNNAELIGDKCVEKRSYFNSPFRLVASFGAMAIVVGLGFQLMKTANTSSTVDQTTVSTANSETVLAAQAPPEVSSNHTAAVVVAQDAASLVATTNPKPLASQNSNTGQNVAQTDPSQFELNENTRSKTWPRSTQGMDEYLVRHNQMVDANSSNGLISYAQILTDEEPSNQEQDDQ